MSEEKKTKTQDASSIDHYTGYVELKDYITYVAEFEPRIIRRCVFPGCITILNQSNVKFSPFCHHHQRVVETFISEEKGSYEYFYFKAVLRKFKPPKLEEIKNGEPEEPED